MYYLLTNFQHYVFNAKLVSHLPSNTSPRHMSLSTSLCHTKSSFIPPDTPSNLHPLRARVLHYASSTVSRPFPTVHSMTSLPLKERLVVSLVIFQCRLSHWTFIVSLAFWASVFKSRVAVVVPEIRQVFRK
jgi:hypothetical protein